MINSKETQVLEPLVAFSVLTVPATRRGENYGLPFAKGFCRWTREGVFNESPLT